MKDVRQHVKQERIGLDDEFNKLIKDFDSFYLVGCQPTHSLTQKLLVILGKMARNRVESGLTRIEDIVDYIHGKLTDIGHDITKRDIRDAISGYGKTVEMSKDAIDVALREAKRQGKLISALEDAQAKVLPLKSGLQRDAATDRVRELTKEVNQLCVSLVLIYSHTKTPEQQWKFT